MNVTTENKTTLITADETANLDKLVVEFNTLYVKTAANMIEMGRIAFEAKKGGKGMYALFCERVMMKGDAAMSKFVAIGKSYELFKSHQECLPSNWTTLYNLTRLPKEDFVEKCFSGEINQELTGVASLKLLGKETEPKRAKSSPAVNTTKEEQTLDGLSVYISCDSAERAIILKEVIEFAQSKGLVVRTSIDFQLYEEPGNDSSVVEVA